MAMRRQPGVYGWKFDELSHRMCQHVFDANPDSALAVGHFCTANRGQFNLNHTLTAAIGPTPPALPTMRSRKRCPGDQRVAYGTHIDERPRWVRPPSADRPSRRSGTRSSDRIRMGSCSQRWSPPLNG
jgi:hypothetical protein